MNPPPPIPEDCGSQIPSANPTATAASTAFPPFSIISNPILLASNFPVDTTPFFPVASLPVLIIFPASS
ncbi:MAG: hypothetical protein RR656_03430 [Cetobacterium sp.]